MTAPSLDGRCFVAVADVTGGEVGTETLFTYHERDGEIWGVFIAFRYVGLAWRLGLLAACGARTASRQSAIFARCARFSPYRGRASGG